MAKNKMLAEKMRQEDTLPEGYSWDQMESGINARLQVGDTVPKYPIYRNLLFCVALVIVLVSAIVNLQDNTPILINSQTSSISSLAKNNTSQAKITQEINTEHSPETATHNSSIKEFYHKEKLGKETTSTPSLDHSLVRQSSTVELDVVNTKNPITPTLMEKRQLITDDNTSDTSFSDISGHNQATLLVNSDLSKAEIDEKNSQDLITENKTSNSSSTIDSKNTLDNPTSSESLSFITILSYDTQYLEVSREKFDLSYALVDSPTAITPGSDDSGKKFGIAILAGSNIWTQNNTTGQLGGEVQQTENAIPGLTTSLLLQYDLSDKWTLSTGIEYRVLNSKLDFEEIYDTTATENLVTKVITNSLDGSVLQEETEDLQLDGTATHKVIHYNKYQRLSIPVLLQRNFTLSNELMISASAGGAYGLSGGSQGKTLVENPLDYRDYQVEVFSGSTTHSFEALVNVGLNYKLSEHIHIKGSLSAAQSLGQLTHTEHPAHQRAVFSSQLGMGYKF